MVQKYERKRWYIPPQQVHTNNANQTAPEPKPLKQLLGENAPTVSVQVRVHVNYACETGLNLSLCCRACCISLLILFSFLCSVIRVLSQ